MNMMVNIQELAAKAAALEDQTEVKNGGGDFEYVPPPAGKTIARFVGYIELGKQPQRPYQGKAKPPADEVRLVFELLNPKKNIRTIQVDGKDTAVADTIGFTVARKLGEKAKFKKLFDMMRYGRDGIRHMAQMLGEDFIVTVFHNESERDGKKVVYANLNDSSGAYHIQAPYIEDPISNERTKINVPENIRPLQVFLYDLPTKDTWDSLFIDGEREIKNGDQVEVRSNNWLQQKILSATDYRGSALEGMLAGLTDLPTEEPEVEMPLESPTLPQDGQKQPSGTQGSPKPVSAADDALAALGLN